ncbi:hypothetical protein GALMADRAFT_241095 [Galerina marginata CBS 339.88]|uniref:Helicase C-terminal domain-containing protein n=1 Tax=Galerina marginata (strain CBS 339.88) TaxID=685588 RepID=A0A067TC12_GALM3|nr:hypothetical protein GALMADRAFT_241095 [Galerina marginata CBS 339.88]
MAKEKPSKSRVQSQKSITSFFGGEKKKAAPPSDTDIASESANDTQHDDAEDDVSTPDEHSSDVDMDASNIPTKKSVKSAAPDASDLPPINDIPAIFEDLVSRIPDIKGVAEHVNGRKLRVATMCSGTESPLLALELVQKSILDQHGLNFDIEHVFSCEIEPFKQAYIERNFHPPLLFRDVCELGDGEAHTAYGSLAPVPGDVDMLIAGTSCVDYSNLNTQKQDIDANGESGRTFRGMMSWVKQHRPPIVILENVCSAPWDRVKEYFEKNGYSAEFSRVDTKAYYIPHTRTRVYLVAVNKKGSSIPTKWKEWVVSKLKRPASSTLDAFLLPSDDPRIHQARQKLVQESFGALDRRTGRTDWGRCESRHQRARLEEALGSKRPLTSWDEGGYCKLPDFAWNDWGVGQVERVWDLMDISLLRSATKGVDPSYKTQVWNLSQNVDRTIGSNKVGICPCLTPSMIPYITNRGGPMVGLEALSMQGLPVDKLLLTRETEDNLADLAGNAMSTTVVGACILAALVTGKSLLKAGDDSQTYEFKHGGELSESRPEAMDVDTISPPSSFPSSVVGEENLVQKPLDLSVMQTSSFSELLAEAEKSKRLCSCEGRIDMTTRPLFRCVDCGGAFCKKCGGRPEHNPEPIDIDSSPRVHPSDFSKKLKSTLPMCISLTNVTKELLDKLRKDETTTIPDARWSSWRAAVLRATGSELRFVELKRQEIWSAVYQSPTGMLELSLHHQQPEWRLYAIPEAGEPANAEIRQVLQSPVGRFACDKDLLQGRWQFALPSLSTISVKIQGASDLVPSWEARLGLIGEEFKSKMVYSQLKISVEPADIEKLDRDISGLYSLLDKCGTANGALHKKAETDANLPPLFILFDPHRTNDSEDCFVFSISTRRLEYQECRPIVCKLDPTWRQSSNHAEEMVSCHLPFKWVSVSSVQLKPSLGQDAQFGTPAKDLDIPFSNQACGDAYALLTCSVPLRGQAGPEWPRGTWADVDKIHERSTFKSLAWLLERIRHVDDHYQSWQEIDNIEGHSNCERCAPSAPQLRWVQSGKKIVAVEDPVQAGEYERRLKRRPSPFVTQLKLADDGTGMVRVGVNIPSILHRAVSRLPTRNRTGKVTLSWRLDTSFTPAANLNLPKFAIMSNKRDREHAQPPSFIIPLRKEQLRSLEWMIHQESSDAAPFIEEEISEAILDPLGWRAEGRAQRPVQIRGGVLADQVGYGKTAITLGLIDCTSKSVAKEFSKKGEIPGKLHVKGTLIVVPPHLTRQWASEVRKFTDKRFEVLVISTVSNLNSTKIEDVQKADIIVVASNIFKSNVYLDNLQLLGGAGELPSKDGRHFNAQLKKTLHSLRSQVDLLQEKGSLAVLNEIKSAQKRLEDELAAEALVVSKRLKGKSYREAATVIEKERETQKKPEGHKAKPVVNQIAKLTTSGLIMEVVIPVKSRNSSVKSSSAPSSPAQDDDEDADSEEPGTRKRKRRAATNKIMIISDDNDSVSEAPIKKASSKSSKASSKKRRIMKRRSPTSDYQGSSSEDEESDVAMESDFDGEEGESPKQNKSSKAKGKAKAIPKPKGKKASSVVEESDETGNDDDMDVDEPASKPAKKVTKRKAADNAARPAKKAKRAESDPWKLGSRAVQSEWTDMQAPPFEMFHFARVVVDEYTYLDGKVHALVTNLTAERQWVLSGTPPIHDFGALKTIAAFLNIHLGVDDDGEGQSAEVKKRRREQTSVERFHSFREVHTLEWHAHRHTIGQVFLDQFVRQNIAEIDEIPWTTKTETIVLPAAERAIYLELEHHLRSLDMVIKRGKKTESDREKRLAQSLGESKSAEEALLKRCSHFDLETSNENAMKACDVIVHERQKQLDQCRTELLKAIKDAVKREKNLGNVGQESMFVEYVRVSRTEGVDDQQSTDMVVELLDEAGAGVPKAKAKSQDVQLTEKTKALVWEHREKTHEMRRITKELVGRVRSLRYFTVVRDLQRQTNKPLEVSCPSCKRDKLPIAEVAVLSSCGHTGCLPCVRSCAEKEECVYAALGQCKSAARVLNVVKAETLGVDDKERHGKGRHFGMKLEKVVELIKKGIKKSERVLVFVQFPDLMKKVAEAFTEHDIKYLEIKGSAPAKSKNLEQFQNDSKERVLLLNVMDESASGANLTSANHAIFLSPLLAPSQEIYTACETQAVGRLVRYGQTKHVTVWRFLTSDTIDEEIYEQREKALKAHAA